VTTKEVLVEARRLIAEKGWAQGDFALDDDGHGYNYDSPRATCYCASGAIRLACPEPYGFVRVEKLFCKANSIEEIPQWNDAEGRTKDEVLAAFDRAIDFAGAK
jgi:hypothetical protein